MAAHHGRPGPHPEANLRDTPKEAEVYQRVPEEAERPGEGAGRADGEQEKKLMADEFAGRKAYEDFLYNIDG